MATIISHSPEETFEVGKRLAGELSAGGIVALTGELGAGKTQLVKGIAAGLGAASEVTSPTFALIHEYNGGRLPLFHMDLYRLDTAEEALRIGLDEYLGSEGVTVIEWADKFAELIPAEARWVAMRSLEDGSREIKTP